MVTKRSDKGVEDEYIANTELIQSTGIQSRVASKVGENLVVSNSSEQFPETGPGPDSQSLESFQKHIQGGDCSDEENVQTAPSNEVLPQNTAQTSLHRKQHASVSKHPVLLSRSRSESVNPIHPAQRTGLESISKAQDPSNSVDHFEKRGALELRKNQTGRGNETLLSNYTLNVPLNETKLATEANPSLVKKRDPSVPHATILNCLPDPGQNSLRELANSLGCIQEGDIALPERKTSGKKNDNVSSMMDPEEASSAQPVNTPDTSKLHENLRKRYGSDFEEILNTMDKKWPLVALAKTDPKKGRKESNVGELLKRRNKRKTLSNPSSAADKTIPRRSHSDELWELLDAKGDNTEPTRGHEKRISHGSNMADLFNMMDYKKLQPSPKKGDEDNLVRGPQKDDLTTVTGVDKTRATQPGVCRNKKKIEMNTANVQKDSDGKTSRLVSFSEIPKRGIDTAKHVMDHREKQRIDSFDVELFESVMGDLNDIQKEATKRKTREKYRVFTFENC